jgi:hypothetical protein
VDADALDGLTLRPDLRGLPGLRAESSGDLARDIAAAICALFRPMLAGASGQN